MTKRRFQLWLLIPVLGVGGIAAFVAGLWVFVAATTSPIHPEADELPLSTGLADPGWTTTIDEARRVIQASVVEQNLPGLSAAVGIGDQVVWSEGLGWANLEPRDPVTPTTRFRVGTLTTVFTSAAVGLLLDEGRLDLDAPLTVWTPTFNEQPTPVSLRQVMAHVAGIRPDEGDEEPARARCGQTTDGLTHFIDRPLIFEPGSQYRYSSYGWRLVSAEIEQASGRRLVRFLHERIFDPLGLSDTQTDAPTDPVVNSATYYFPRFAADTRYGPQAPGPTDFSCFSGSAFLLSTATDVVRFVAAFNAGRLVRPETARLLQAAQPLPSGADTGYGLGWDLETVTVGGRELRVIFHDGDMHGGRVASFIVVPSPDVPNRDLVVALLANTAHADTATLALRVADIFIGAR